MSEVNKKVSECFKQAVRDAVAKGNHVRFGNAESEAIIAKLVELLVNDEEVAAEGYDAIALKVGSVVNPSAFAQKLEELPTDHPSYVCRPKRGERKASSVDV